MPAPSDLVRLVSAARRVAGREIDLHLPPGFDGVDVATGAREGGGIVSGDDGMRKGVIELVDEVSLRVFVWAFCLFPHRRNGVRIVFSNSCFRYVWISL